MTVSNVQYYLIENDLELFSLLLICFSYFWMGDTLMSNEDLPLLSGKIYNS